LRELPEDLIVLLGGDARAADHDGHRRLAGLGPGGSYAYVRPQRAVRHDAQPLVPADGTDRGGLAGAEHEVRDPAREASRTAAADRFRTARSR
jgi:hypothetical protein